MRKIGILGGTFDPVHMGHLIGAEIAADTLALERVLFVPAAAPPHKCLRVITDSAHRLNMLREAVADNPRFEVLTDEIERGGASYTVDTVAGLKSRLGPDTELYLVVGADNLVDFNSWKDWRVIVRACRLVGLERPDSRDAREVVGRKIPELDIHWVGMPQVDISSTLIRRLAAEGRSVRYMLPDRVMEYILRNALYSDYHE